MLITINTDPSSVMDNVFGEAHSLDCSIFGPSGYREYAREHRLSDFKPVYGNYAIVTRSGARINIDTDHFGLYRLYVYRHKDFWVVSDSISDLVGAARGNGMPLTPYVPAVYGFRLKSGMGHQLATFRTPIAEVELVPHWWNIRINDRRIEFVKKKDVIWSSDLHETFLKTGHFFASLLKSYLDNDVRPFVKMSAGLDSRCTLAAMLSMRNHSRLGAVGLHTSNSPKFSEEKEIVLNLLGKLPFSGSSKPIASHRPVSWAGWKRYFLGGQSHVATYPAYGLPKPCFTGASGELAREFYDWDGRSETLDFVSPIPPDAKNLLLTDIDTAMSSFDAQCKELHTSDNKHYQMFRNRFHFGRNQSESIFRFPPLVYSLLSAGTGSGNKEPIHRMIYELGGEDLLLHAFDSPAKAYSNAIPPDWRRIEFSSSDLGERTLFRGHAGGDRSDGDHREFAPGDLNWDRGSLISESFIRDGDLAIQRVGALDLLESSFMRGARHQLNRLKNERDNALPGYYPALMGVMALDMTSF